MELKAVDISKKYPRKLKEANYFYAVNPVSLNLEPGKVIEIMGRSGSGKSTLLHMMAGLLLPSEGKVFLDDRDLYAMSDRELSRQRNRYFGVIPQGQTGLYSLTVLENVLLPCTLYDGQAGSCDKDDRDYALELLERLDIGHLARAYPGELSGGELKRLAIARALTGKPSIILADEPTGDLDDENTAVVFRLLREAADKGAAVLVVTHETQAVEYADMVFRMNGGSLVSEQPD